jgi:hypothetical protein
MLHPWPPVQGIGSRKHVLVSCCIHRAHHLGVWCRQRCEQPDPLTQKGVRLCPRILETFAPSRSNCFPSFLGCSGLLSFPSFLGCFFVRPPAQLKWGRWVGGCVCVCVCARTHEMQGCSLAKSMLCVFQLLL